MLRLVETLRRILLVQGLSFAETFLGVLTLSLHFPLMDLDLNLETLVVNEASRRQRDCYLLVPHHHVPEALLLPRLVVLDQVGLLDFAINHEYLKQITVCPFSWDVVDKQAGFLLACL